MNEYGNGGDLTVTMDGPFASGAGGTIEKVTQINVLATDWKGGESPFSQAVTIEGISVNHKVDIYLSATQLEQLSKKRISFTAENSSGVVTLYAVGDKPDVDLVFQASLSEIIRSGSGGYGKIYGNTIETIAAVEPSLLLSGGTMEGDIDMGNHAVTNIKPPVGDNDAVNKAYADNIRSFAEGAKETADAKCQKQTTTATLTASGWSGKNQVVSVPGVLADGTKCDVLVSPVEDSRELYNDCVVRCTAQGNNTLTFMCDDVPSDTLTVGVIILV